MKAIAGMIPLLRPRLPLAAGLLPYLLQIDKARSYANRGPLLQGLEVRFADHFGLRPEGIATFANATLGLTLTMQAQGAVAGTLCLMPAWTFIASPLAALAAGLVPYFSDVDEYSWALTPALAERAIRDAPGPVGAVMPVAPFGQPLDEHEWSQFSARIGVPVVIDAAAAFDGQKPGLVPSVISLHATKALGIGEGALIATHDVDLVRRCLSLQSFGFEGTRSAIRKGCNAKLSEYGAAIGHAALDGWPETRAAFAALAARYRQALAVESGLFQAGFGQRWISATCVIRLPEGRRTRVEAALSEAGIESRRWWDNGAHMHPATSEFPRAALPVTERLAADTLGVPFHLDLTAADIDHIASVIARSLT